MLTLASLVKNPCRLVGKALLLTTLFLAPLPAKASDKIEDTAIPIAESLGKKLGPKLIKDKATTIFLSAAGCETPELDSLNSSPSISGGDDAWCTAFWATLEETLSDQGISFLPESAREKIREEIAAEQTYQNSSMQVDPEKIVELGKQQAFQAFVTVMVKRSAKGQVIAKASSVSIKKGTINISEKVNGSIKRSRERSWSAAFLGYGSLVLGLGATGAFFVAAEKARDRSDAAYINYKNSTDTTSAVSFRQRAEKADKEFQYYNYGAGVGGCLALLGILKLVYSQEDHYELEMDRKFGERLSPSDSRWSLVPSVESQSMQLSFALSF